MLQTGTIRVAKISGIAIDVHFTFALVILWGAYDGWVQHGGTLEGALYGIVGIVLLFACVLLHELAHALQARTFGLVVRRIILLPIGGLALLETLPSKPWHELILVLAGPMINFALAAGAATLLMIVSPGYVFTSSILTATFNSPGIEGILQYLFSVNLSLFLFNILPAFPMDGGRILRAGLALIASYVTATRIAAWIGRTLAVLIIGYGVVATFTLSIALGVLLIVVGVVVYIGAYNEEIHVRSQWVLARVEVGQIFQKRIETIAPWDDLTTALISRLFKYESILPVVVDERIVGLLSYDEAYRYTSKSQTMTVAHVMRTNFPTLRLRDTLWVAQQAMIADQLTMLPIVEENRFQGVVSLDDINQAWRLVTGS